MMPFPSNFHFTPPAEAFAASTLAIVGSSGGCELDNGDGDGDPPQTAPRVHRTSAYYRDSSGRARVHLRLRLAVPNGMAVALLECGCIVPPPEEDDDGDGGDGDVDGEGGSGDGGEGEEGGGAEGGAKEGEGGGGGGGGEEEIWRDELATIGKEVGADPDPSPWEAVTSFRFECSIAPTEDGGISPSSAVAAIRAVEGVSVRRTRIEREGKRHSPVVALVFDVEIAVRGVGGGGGIPMEFDGGEGAGVTASEEEEGCLHVRAVLSQTYKFRGSGNAKEEVRGRGREGPSVSTAASLALLKGGGPFSAPGLLGLELGGGAIGSRATAYFTDDADLAYVRDPSSSDEDDDDRHDDGNGGATSDVSSFFQRNKKGSAPSPEVHYGATALRAPPLSAPPLAVWAALVPALRLSVREVAGARAASGATFVEILVEHATTSGAGAGGGGGDHRNQEQVTVTGIAFHPGQSRLANGASAMAIGMGERGDDSGGDGLGGEGDDDSAAPSPYYRNDNGGGNNNAASLAHQQQQPSPLPIEGRSMQGGELSVIDMSRRVRWGFAPGTAPDLPLVLGPHEALATVLQIDAGEDVRSRAFWSPVSVNAVVGSDGKGETSAPATPEDGERIMITADARWTTSRVAVEHSDAFRVDMNLLRSTAAVAIRRQNSSSSSVPHQTVCRVGAPIIISLRVLNLSLETRDLMLLMAKDGEGGTGGREGLRWERPPVRKDRRARLSCRRDCGEQAKEVVMLHRHHRQGYQEEQRRLQKQQQQSSSSTSSLQPPQETHGFNTAVVSEVNGYTFGVWGLSGEDDGTTRHHRDHELLAVDAALLLGEVKGQHSIEAELRFVPLREGTLDVPNLKLYDKRGGRWYNCVHTLKIVAAAKT